VDVLWLFLVFLRASFLSLGGQSALPLIRQDLVSAGLMTDQQIIEALTIGRLGTGPGGLYIIALGYFAMGWLGAVAALVATTLPPLLVVPLSAYLRPRLGRARINGTIRGLALATSGLVLMTSVQLFMAEMDGGPVEPWRVAVLGSAFVVAVRGRWHPIWIIGVAGIVGLLLAPA
jgi:chromate transporter